MQPSRGTALWHREHGISADIGFLSNAVGLSSRGSLGAWACGLGAVDAMVAIGLASSLLEARQSIARIHFFMRISTCVGMLFVLWLVESLPCNKCRLGAW